MRRARSIFWRKLRTALRLPLADRPGTGPVRHPWAIPAGCGVPLYRGGRTLGVTQ